MELLALSFLFIFSGALLGHSFGYKRGFKHGRSDEQVFFALVITKLARRNNDANLIDQTAREYNLLIMELQQKIRDTNEGR